MFYSWLSTENVCLFRNLLRRGERPRNILKQTCCSLCVGETGCLWYKILNPLMFIPQYLHARLKRLSNETSNPNLVRMAMVHAVKGSIHVIRTKAVCDLLLKLRQTNIGRTNVCFIHENVCLFRKLLRRGERPRNIFKKNCCSLCVGETGCLWYEILNPQMFNKTLFLV